MKRRGIAGRFSETLLRLAMRDREAFDGLVGDLEEEASRDGASRRVDNRVLVALAGRYALDALRHFVSSGGSRRLAQTRQRRRQAAIVEDFRLAARLLRRRRGFAVAVVGTLALGFGAAGAVLSVAYGVWLRPLPFAGPRDLVRIYEVRLEGDEGSLSGDAPNRPAAFDADVTRRSRLSPPLLHDLRAADWASLTGIAAVSGISYDWERDGGAQRISGVTASRGVFSVLGLEPLAGRFFSDVAGTREVVLSEGLWRRAFGAARSVVGTDFLTLDGERYLIVGVAPDGLPYPQVAGEVWTPFDPSGDDLSEGMRGARYLDVVARLRSGADLVAARGELDAFLRDLGTEHEQHAGWSATAVSLREDLARPFVDTLQLLLGAAALFLLIACTNVAGLVATRRIRDRGQRELCLALGAARARLLRQEVAEMVLLGAAACLPAAAITAAAMAPLRNLAPADMPRLAEIRPDALVIGLLGITLLAACIVISLLGNALGRRPQVPKRGPHPTTTAPTTPRSVLMVAQVALTTVLLLGGAALAHHFRGLATARPGFNAEGIAVAPVVLNAYAYGDDALRLQFFEATIEGLQRRGHLAAVGVNPPVSGSTMRFGYRAGDGSNVDAEEQHWGQYHVVSPDYFEVLEIPLVSGRVFEPTDREGAMPVVIINETLARAHFAIDPVGREMTVVGTTRRIVGVVGSVAHFGPDRAPPAEMYVPLAQDPWLLGHLLIRPIDNYAADDARSVAASIDATVPVPMLAPYEEYLRTWFAPLRFQLTIVSLLAIAGAALAIVGLYSLIAFVVADRTREIGIRVALGESAGSIFAAVVGRGLGLASAGIVLGIAIALSLRGTLGAAGVGGELDEPMVATGVAAVVLAAAFAAAAWPARRAARVDPVEALRRN